MSDNPHQLLDALQPEKQFFIGIDSDGCVFDSMEIKHKECFCPEYIRHFRLQRVSKYARETWEFVNLYSKTRGTNRFKALVRSMQLLAERKEVRQRGTEITDLAPLNEWMKQESKLGNPALEIYTKKSDNPVLQQVLAWSNDVNASIEKMVSDVPPFPLVKESLEKIYPAADLMVVSQTPVAALKREWEEHQIDKYVMMIAGQEYGTKTEHITYAAKNKYPDNQILMIGDAPGDLAAAKDNGVLFFPVNPGHEEQSWERFFNEGAERFFSGTFAGKYEDGLIKEFNALLPENPGWSK
ncbi:MAG: HAD hydrolase-like protein [Ignavibacteriaceae bacterium]|nr:HAD hydrolase-like protein [Ignavibacteriaceae bacterium]